MKIVIAAALVLIVLQLGFIAYEIRRSTWSAEDQACYSPIGSADKEEMCRLLWQSQHLS